jgi:hypothetical protein
VAVSNRLAFVLSFLSCWYAGIDYEKFKNTSAHCSDIIWSNSKTFCQGRASSVKTILKDIGNKSSYKSKRSKKAVRNYTHTLPADGARATTLSAAKKYHKITRLALKNTFQKWSVRKS